MFPSRYSHNITRRLYQFFRKTSITCGTLLCNMVVLVSRFRAFQRSQSYLIKGLRAILIRSNFRSEFQQPSCHCQPSENPANGNQPPGKFLGGSEPLLVRRGPLRDLRLLIARKPDARLITAAAIARPPPDLVARLGGIEVCLHLRERMAMERSLEIEQRDVRLDPKDFGFDGADESLHGRGRNQRNGRAAGARSKMKHGWRRNSRSGRNARADGSA